ncbi:MAG: helix-turn-helix domain-containing protein [Bacteroidetes bacterium]|nr:helix-turn-helix domain-containing protein [Bacteroidota bacterium]
MGLGKKIEERRKAKDLTQGELGELMNVGYVQVGRWEKGEPDLKLSQLKELSKHLGYDFVGYINSELSDRPSILIPEEVRTAVEVLNKFVNQNEVEKPVKRRPEPDKT